MAHISCTELVFFLESKVTLFNESCQCVWTDIYNTVEIMVLVYVQQRSGRSPSGTGLGRPAADRSLEARAPSCLDPEAAPVARDRLCRVSPALIRSRNDSGAM